MTKDDESLQRDSFIFYRSFYQAVTKLEPSIKSTFLDILCNYALDGKLPEQDADPIIEAIFMLIRPQIDANTNRWKNGKKGGRKNKYETKMEPRINRSKTTQQPNVNENVNENAKATLPSIPEKPKEGGVAFFEKCFAFITERFPQLVPSNSAPIYAWQQAGYDFETQIKPTIESAAAKAMKPRSFNFFTPMLEDIGRKKIEPAKKQEKPRELTLAEKQRNSEFMQKVGIYVT